MRVSRGLAVLPYLLLFIFVCNYINECLILQCEFIWLMDCDFKGSLPGSIVEIAMPMAQFTFATCIRNLVMVPSVSIVLFSYQLSMGFGLW